MPTVSVETDLFEEVNAAVSAGLKAYNDRFLPSPRERKPLAISLTDDGGRIIGGLIGQIQLDWLYVELLWIDESLKGQGYGKRLLEEAERQVRAFGGTHIHLWTWSFQAPDFYRAMGFEEWGRLKDHPSGHDCIQFVRWLHQPPTSAL
jgi:GNAT superfamily N-acetyltransferase